MVPNDTRAVACCLLPFYRPRARVKQVHGRHTASNEALVGFGSAHVAEDKDGGPRGNVCGGVEVCGWEDVLCVAVDVEATGGRSRSPGRRGAEDDDVVVYDEVGVVRVLV